jgi:hypothetical protein
MPKSQVSRQNLIKFNIMAEFKIDGRMKVRKLKEDFFNEYGGVLRVYNGKERADDDASLASIRANDVARGGELVCRSNRSVGNFKKEMWEVFGIKVQVATKDDWVIVLDGITLSTIKKIPNYASKESMQEFLGNVARATKEAGASIATSLSKLKDVTKEALENINNNIKKVGGNMYESILKNLEGKKLIYVPTYEQNEDGCSLGGINYPEDALESPVDAYNEINAPIGDYENGEISCFEECDKIDLNKDGVYFNPKTYEAVAVLGGQIISALCNDGETLSIGDQEFDVNEL